VRSGKRDGRREMREVVVLKISDLMLDAEGAFERFMTMISFR
jgi:hypothetical protein